MATTIRLPDGYRIQTPATLAATLGEVPALKSLLGGRPVDWRVEEVGDGNLNLVFKVRGPAGGVAVKQALPYVRLVGESWPLPLSRAHYEHMALIIEARHAGHLVPAIHHYDRTLALIAMELLEPHVIMRRGMIEGQIYPRFVEDITDFMAATLFHTSDLAMAAEPKKLLIAAFAGNTALCKITEDLIFTEPYMQAANNRWTRPYLDPFAQRLRQDDDLKVAVSRLKLKFLSSAEAMIHGDLHTGSVMVTQTETRVIDPEFAFIGPIGFDVGAVIANLLISYFSQDGHELSAGARDDYRTWIVECVAGVWNGFRRKFLAHWQQSPTGDAFPVTLFSGPQGEAALAREREAYMDRLYADVIGFAAAKMIRRVVGLAHNIDLEWIKDPRQRAVCEARVLTLARQLMVEADRFPDVGDVCERAQAVRRWSPPLG